MAKEFKDVIPDNTYNPQRRGIGTIDVFSVSDLTFPLATGRYILKNDITISQSITTAIGSSVYIEADGGGRTLTLDGTLGDLITGNATFGVLVMNGFNVSITGASSNLFNMTNMLFSARECNFLFAGSLAQNIGSISNSALSITFLDCIFDKWQGGLIVDNPATRVLIDRCQFSSDLTGAGDAITIGANMPEFECLQTEFALANGETLFSINNGLTGRCLIAGIRNFNVNSVFFNPAGLNQVSPRVNLSGSEPEESSNNSIELKTQNDAISVDIPAASAKVIVYQNNYVTEEVKRFTIDVNGVSTFIGLAPLDMRLDGNVYFEPTASTKQCVTGFFGLLPTEATVTFTNATNIVNEVGTSLVNGDMICFYDTQGTLPTEIRKDVLYYVVNKATDSFQISYTSGGAAIAFTTDGTGSNTYKIITIHGAEPKEPIAANNPRTLVPQGLLDMVTNEKVGVFVGNLDDATNLLVTDCYYRVVE